MSDIRKIQTGSNQYTLHARVSDKLAIMCSSRTHNKSNYPFHRILKTDVYTNASYENHGITLCLSEHYSSQLARFGIVNIEFSQQGSNNSVAHIIWVVRNGFKIDDIQAGLFATANGTYIDVYLKNEVLDTGISIYCMNEGNRGIETQTYKFVNSDEVNDTTATDKKTSYEVYKTIEEAATQLHGKAYTSIIKPIDSGTVANAGYAQKIGTNKSHPQIGSTTKPVYVDSSGEVQACSREIPNIPYSVTKINPGNIGVDFTYDTINSYHGPQDYCMPRIFFLEPGDKITVHTTHSYNFPLYFVDINDESFDVNGGSYYLNIKVNTPVTVDDHVVCVLRSSYHESLPEGYVEIYRNNSTTTDTLRLISEDLSNFLGVEQADGLYAKKTDGPFRYQGSVDSLSNLPSLNDLTRENAGYVYKIRTASTNDSITTNPGDYVVFAWEETKNAGHWDNLSGTVKLSDYLKKGGSQTTTSTEDSGSNVYTFTDGSTITVKNGSKGSTGTSATWFSGGAVTGTSTTAKTFIVSGSKAGDMYLNTETSNVYKATAANQWVYLCNIKGSQGTPGNNGTTPTIKAAAGGNIGAVGTPSVTANTSGTTTTFTFNNLKGQKGDTGATVIWHTGTAVTGTAATVAGAKTGDMYLNTKTYNVYKSTGTNKWVGVCNIKGANGTTPTIKAAAGDNINSVGTPTVSATASGATTTFTFNNLKGQKGDTGATITWHSGTAVPNAGVHAVTNAKVGDMYLNTHTCDVFKAANAVQESFNWVLVCNIKGAKGDAADIPKLTKGVAGIVPGTTNDDLNASRWLNGGKDGTGAWSPLPTAGGGTSGIVRTCKDYTSNAANPVGYGHSSTPPTIQPLTSGANDYRGVECDKQGMLFVNVPAYEKNINRAQNTVLAAPTTGTGTATFRKLTTSDIPWDDKLKVVTESQFYSIKPEAGVFYFLLEA